MSWSGRTEERREAEMVEHEMRYKDSLIKIVFACDGRVFVYSPLVRGQEERTPPMVEIAEIDPVAGSGDKNTSLGTKSGPLQLMNATPKREESRNFARSISSKTPVSNGISL